MDARGSRASKEGMATTEEEEQDRILGTGGRLSMSTEVLGATEEEVRRALNRPPPKGSESSNKSAELFDKGEDGDTFRNRNRVDRAMTRQNTVTIAKKEKSPSGSREGSPKGGRSKSPKQEQAAVVEQVAVRRKPETIVRVKVHILAITSKTARVVLDPRLPPTRGDGGLSSRLAHSGLRAIDEYRIKAARRGIPASRSVSSRPPAVHYAEPPPFHPGNLSLRSLSQHLSDVLMRTKGIHSPAIFTVSNKRELFKLAKQHGIDLSFTGYMQRDYGQDSMMLSTARSDATETYQSEGLDTFRTDIIDLPSLEEDAKLPSAREGSFKRPMLTRQSTQEIVSVHTSRQPTSRDKLARAASMFRVPDLVEGFRIWKAYAAEMRAKVGAPIASLRSPPISARSISLNVPATASTTTTTTRSSISTALPTSRSSGTLSARGSTSLNTARSTGLSTARSTGGGPLSARSNTSTTSTYRRHQVYGAYQHPLPALSLAGSLRGLPASHASGSPRTMALDMARVTLDEVNNRLQFEDMGFDARSSGRREERKRIKKREKEAEEDAKNRRLFNAAKTLQRALKQRYLRRTLVERKQRKNAIIIQRACRAWLWRRYGDDYAAIVLEQYTARCKYYADLDQYFREMLIEIQEEAISKIFGRKRGKVGGMQGGRLDGRRAYQQSLASAPAAPAEAPATPSKGRQRRPSLTATPSTGGAGGSSPSTGTRTPRSGGSSKGANSPRGGGSARRATM